MLEYFAFLLALPAVFSEEIFTTSGGIGAPLNAADLALAATLPPHNITQEQMHEFVARGEAYAAKRNTRNVLAEIKEHWPNAVVPYTIDAAFDDVERAIIADGVQDIESKTCIRFVPRTTETEYMILKTGEPGCWAYVGYSAGLSNKYHVVNLQQAGCVYVKIVVHELLHILGVYHEQQRPDRDDYLTMHWDNLEGEAGNNFFLDQWDTTPDSDLPPSVCSTTGLSGSQTRDFSNCWSGHRVSAHGYPFDFKSVMMYGLKSFAVDSSKNVMTPKDTTITSVGSNVMTTLDAKKLAAAYSCSDAEVNNCGGSVSGDSGTITSGGQASCDWLITVEEGFAIKLSTTAFQATCPSKLEFRNGNTKISSLINSYCDADAPSMVISPGSSLYITWAMVGAGQSFTATWEKIAVTCCDEITMASTGLTADQLPNWLGTYTHTDGDDVNGRPIYRMGTKWLANKGTQWVVSQTSWGAPGTGSGLMFGDGTSMCPTAVGEWKALNQVSAAIEAEPTLNAACAAACPAAAVPVAPTGAVTTWNGEVTVNTVVSYTCSATETLYAYCASTGAWEPATIPPCSETPPTLQTVVPTTVVPTVTVVPTTVVPGACVPAKKYNKVTSTNCIEIKSHATWDGVTKYRSRSRQVWHVNHRKCEILVTCEGFDIRQTSPDCSRGDRLKIVQGKVAENYCGTEGPDGNIYTRRRRTSFKFMTNSRGVNTGFKCNISCM